MTITIYCLFDPRTNIPFYVGATKDIKLRLYQHIRYTKTHRVKAERFREGGQHVLKYFPHFRKTLTMCDILDSGHKPGLCVLYITVGEKNAAYYEEFYYKALKSQGFDIQQEHNKFYHSNKSGQSWIERYMISTNTYLLRISQ